MDRCSVDSGLYERCHSHGLTATCSQHEGKDILFDVYSTAGVIGNLGGFGNTYSCPRGRHHSFRCVGTVYFFSTKTEYRAHYS